MENHDSKICPHRVCAKANHLEQLVFAGGFVLVDQPTHDPRQSKFYSLKRPNPYMRQIPALLHHHRIQEELLEGPLQNFLLRPRASATNGHPESAI
jgi:hypothetical protein